MVTLVLQDWRDDGGPDLQINWPPGFYPRDWRRQIERAGEAAYRGYWTLSFVVPQWGGGWRHKEGIGRIVADRLTWAGTGVHFRERGEG